MLETATGWGLDVDRGPDWIFVRVHPRDGFDDAPGLAESVWTVLEQHFIYRVVLEIDEIALLHSPIIGQLVLLSKRVHTHGGLLRLCRVYGGRGRLVVDDVDGGHVRRAAARGGGARNIQLAEAAEILGHLRQMRLPATAQEDGRGRQQCEKAQGHGLNRRMIVDGSLCSATG